MRVFSSEIEFTKKIAGVLAETAISHIDSQNLKEFMKEMIFIKQEYGSKFEYVGMILDSVLTMIKPFTQREFFIFSGENESGISLVEINSFPPEGYCFFGWIRIEPNLKISREPVTIYKFASKNEMEIELFLEDHFLYYSVRINNRTLIR